jgi:hypothetical protein
MRLAEELDWKEFIPFSLLNFVLQSVLPFFSGHLPEDLRNKILSSFNENFLGRKPRKDANYFPRFFRDKIRPHLRGDGVATDENMAHAHCMLDT